MIYKLQTARPIPGKDDDVTPTGIGCYAAALRVWRPSAPATGSPLANYPGLSPRLQPPAVP